MRKRVKKFGEPFALFGVAKMGKTDEDIQVHGQLIHGLKAIGIEIDAEIAEM